MPEFVETQPQPTSSANSSLWGRLMDRLPILESVLGAMVLDAIDITDVPLVSWWYGIPASLLLGYWVASLFKFQFATRLGMACLAAIYFMLPGTEALPLATIVVAAARLAGVGQVVSHVRKRPALPK